MPLNIFIWVPPGQFGCWEAAKVYSFRVKLGELDSSHFIADRTVSKVVACNTVSKYDSFFAPEVRMTIRDENSETKYSFASDMTSLALCTLVLFMKGELLATLCKEII